MKLSVEPRILFGKKTKLLRHENRVPAVIYGKHLASSLHIMINKVKLVKMYHAAGLSTPVQLTWMDTDHLVLFNNIQLDPVTDHVIHVEFLAVNKDEKVGAEVPLYLSGQSIFEKNGLWRVQLLKDSIHVIALPLDLPRDIQIDISHIDREGQVIHISDINVSDEVQIDEDIETAIATSVAYKEEKEEVVVETVAEGTEEGAVDASEGGTAWDEEAKSEEAAE